MADPQAVHDDQEEEVYRPWYLDPGQPHPYKVSRKITPGKQNNVADFRALAMFPWGLDSLNMIWSGKHSPALDEPWKHVVSEYWDAVAVTSDYSLYIIFTQQKKASLSIRLPEDTQTILEADVMSVAWALNVDEPLEPLVLFSRGSLLYSYSPTRLGLRACIRGHGGTITSIAVHPTQPHLACTTSRDYSTRVYDLSLDAVIPVPDNVARTAKAKDEQVDNPCWPPILKPSLASAAHGLRLPLSENEGVGKGRCIAVMVGGRSGGHLAAVLGAAFHPSLPLIATCGLDRAVKIWPMRPYSTTRIKREDKPLFSSSMIHRGRVLSISWLQEDLLLTHSAPAIMRKDPDDANKKDTYVEQGELSIWRWLSLNRFFPMEEISRPSLRGISSDYQESSSFKIISTYAFPSVSSQLIAPRLSLFQYPYHDPLIFIIYPQSISFSVTNPRFMSPRPLYSFPRRIAAVLTGTGDPPPPPPTPPEEEPVIAEPGVVISPNDAMSPFAIPQTQAAAAEPPKEPRYMMRLSGPDGELDHNDDDDDDDDDNPPPKDGSDEDDEDEPQEITGDINRRPPVEVPLIRPGWELGLATGEGQRDEGQRMMACAMGIGGRVVVAVGTKGTLWVWRNDKL